MAGTLTVEEADSLVASIPGIAALHVVHPGPRFSYVAVNERAEQALGRSAAELAGVDVTEVFGPAAQEQLTAILLRAVAAEGPVPFTTVLPTTSGPVALDAVLTPFFDESGTPVQVLWAAVDQTGLHAAEQALARSEARFRSLVHNAFDGVGVVDDDGRYVWVSPSLDRLMGLASGSLLGRSALELVHPDDVEGAAHELANSTVQTEGEQTWVGRARHASGDWRVLEVQGTDLRHDPNVGGIVLNVRDITEHHRAEEALRASERDYRHQALHDSLTGLPNRALFLDRATQAVAGLGRHGGWVAVLFCDLDGFKWLNDSYGHTLGDSVVAEIGRRISRAVRGTDTVARFGGDEFLILCPDLRHPEEALSSAERLLGSVRVPLDVGGVDLHLTMSVGIALTDGSDVTPSELVAQADAAMYEAKRSGRDRLAVFDHSLLARARERIEIGGEFRRALAEQELVLHYQPIMEVSTGRSCGVEALVRWQHPERGLLLPGEFLPVIEESGLMNHLDTWVLETAAAEARTRPGSFTNVNMSARRLAEPGLADQVHGVLCRSGLPANQLRLEVTESAVMEDVRRAAESLGRLRELGVKVGIDDFGTGHSSLAYLRSLPLDFLKIDRRFVATLGVSSADEAIVRAIVHMAHALELDAIAEGVETTGQLAILSALGCDAIQGWYVGYPEPPDQGDRPVIGTTDLGGL